MTTIEEILKRLESLTVEEQRAVLDYTERLLAKHQEPGERRARRNVKGALSHLGVHVSEEDIREMRREAWKNFPREIES